MLLALRDLKRNTACYASGVREFRWTDVARGHLEGLTFSDVIDVLYASVSEQVARWLPGGGQIVMGRAESGRFIAVLLVPDQGAWEISFARLMTPSEIEEWRKWKAN